MSTDGPPRPGPGQVAQHRLRQTGTKSSTKSGREHPETGSRTR